MNSFIENLNQWGENFLSFAWPMLWQSSLLIAGLFTFDLLFRRKLRASIRYALWLVVLVKLCVPPTLALPTSPAWWLHHTPSPAVAKPAPHYTITYDDAPMQPYIAPPTVAMPAPPLPRLELAGWALAGSMTVSVGLLLWLALRWWQVARMVRRATATEQFSEALDDALRLVGVPETGVPTVRLKIVEGRMSPAVCGLLRPVILLPRALAEKLSAGQLRAVLLHELIHLRRRDVWVNFLQALLQIFYWWHPLLWVANARIRRVREEAVDDAVMLALRDDADHYAPTLLEVAKLALHRPLASLGLVGIMESRHALRQRIERLVDFRAPRHAGLTLVSLLGILAFTAVAVPMGEGPAPVEKQLAPADLNTNVSTNESLGEPEVVTTNGRHAQMRAQNLVENVVATTAQPLGVASKTNRPMVLITAQIYQMRATEFEKVVKQMDSVNVPGGQSFVGTVGADHLTALHIQTSHGKPAKFFNGYTVVGYSTNGVEFDCLPLVGNQVVELAFGLNILGDLAKDGTNLIGKAKHTVNGRVTAENHGGIVACADNPDGLVKTKFVAVIGVEILTNKPPARSNQQKAVVVGKIIGTDTAKVLAEQSASDGSRVMTFKLDGTVREDALRRALLDAGVKIPPTVFYYSDGGILLVRGSLGQLALVNRALLKLNGTSPAEIEASMAGFSKRLAETKPDHGYPTNLFFTRTFKMDERTFRASLRKTGADISDLTNSPAVVGAAVKKLFTSLGVDLESPVGKSVFYNDQNGMLFVRATAGDLEVIEQAIQAFNYTPPQVHIKARFIEVPKGKGGASGFDWYLGQLNATNVKAGSSTPSNVPVSAANPLGVFPGNSVSSTQTLLKNSTPATAQLTGILTDPNFRVVLQALKNSSGFETLGEPEVVTTSGRQCQIRQTQVISLVTNFSLVEAVTNFNGKLERTTAILPGVMPLETGQVFDVVPAVLADGDKLDLEMTASSAEFFGYATIPSNTVPVIATNSAGETINLPSVWPAVQVYRKSAHVVLYDGQTAVLALRNPEQVKFAAPDSQREAAVANLIRDDRRKNHAGGNDILVFITATIVDPAGNRVHADEELPFAQKGIPPQPQAK
ncbi:MAG: Methicillin resistance mecR1 protein [Verrucomicrobiota bacterium]